eukprot:TRINITY_DN31082_c0_g1_i1.p1 TRINITY_DN31082_c0_g1~~TRINITY_DN31082_c0_g1_i1.p1  ORF type:complete len:223 (+),score=7.40 TRINITY_DN31082_c0_g1_i1:43-669(+)
MFSLSSSSRGLFRQSKSCHRTFAASFSSSPALAQSPDVVYHSVPPASQPGVHSHLSEEQMKEMKALRRQDPAKYTQHFLARKYNVSRLVVAKYAPAPYSRQKELERLEKERALKLLDDSIARKQRIRAWEDKHIALHQLAKAAKKTQPPPPQDDPMQRLDQKHLRGGKQIDSPAKPSTRFGPLPVASLGPQHLINELKEKSSIGSPSK